MPLDLEPVLDLAPVGESNDAAPNGLDLEPVENAAPPARELDGRSGEKPLTDLSETVPGFVNRVMEKAGRAGVAAVNWLNDPHPETWLGMKRLPDRPGRQEYGKPMVTLAEPLTPEEAAGMPAPAAGLYNALAKGANTLTTPEMIMAGPLFQAPVAGAALRLAFGAQMGVNTPEALKRMMDPDLTPAERWEAGGTAAILGGMAGLSLKGPGGEGKAEPKIEAKAKLDLEPVSEFGGVHPVPEQAETVAAQLDWLKQGKRKAVLVTPGEAAPEIPAGMEAHPTDKGVFIFDPKQTTPGAIDEAVKGDRIGELLGYGIPRKPEGAETAVVVRSAEGTEKQAVVTDPANAAKVIAAAKAAADPGDTIGLEPAAAVIAQRQAPSRILQKAAREMVDAREPVPKSVVEQFPVGTFALPEGYELQGDKYVFSAPAERLTPEQQAARENAQAMAELRAQKESSEPPEDPDWSVPEEPERTDRRPEPGVPMPVYGERPPDILDWIEGNYPGVKVTNPEDYGTYVDEATGRSKKLVSKTKGEPADKIIEEMHAQGMYRRIESEDDLLEAMNKAASARKAWRRKGMVAGSEQMLAEGVDAKVGTGVGLQYGLQPERAKAALRDETNYQQEFALYPRDETAAAGQPGGAGELARRRAAQQRTEAALGRHETGALHKELSRPVRRISSIDPTRAPTTIPQFNVNGYTITTAADFARLLMPLRSPYAESLKIAILDKEGKVVHSQVLYAGNLDSTVIDFQDIQRLMTIHGDKGNRLMVSHNHPSGEVDPSGADIFLTRRLQRYAAKAGFEVVDHVITDGDRYYSFQSEQVEPLSGGTLAPWETMRRADLQPMPGAEQFQQLVEKLRQGNPDVAHIIYVNTRAKVTAIERVEPNEESVWNAFKDGYPREGAKSVLVDFGPTVEAMEASRIIRGINNSLEGTTVRIQDFAAKGTFSGLASGWLHEGEAPTYNPNALREELERRQTGEKIEGSTAISDPVKQAITEYLYRVRSNATDEAIAADIVGKMGLDTAEQIVRNPPIGMAQATVSKLIGEITRTLARQEQGLRTAGDVGRADAIAQRQAQLWNDMLPKITEMAQGLQALTDIVDMSPDAQVARLKLKLDREAGLKLDAQRPELEQIKAALEQGRNEGVEGVRQDPEVNAAARKAVDAAVAENPEVKNAIVMELAGPWSESPAILAHARQLVRSRVDEMMTTERPPAKKLTPAAVYARELMDDLARRAANIFAMHLQGAEPETGIVEKFKRDLGLSDPKAKEMAASLQKEWDKQLKAAQAKLPKRIANARATRQRNAGESPNSPTAAVDARIRKELDAMNTKLGTVLRQEAERRDQTGEHVAERVVQASGLQGEEADTLRTILKNRWDTIVTEAQRRTLERLQRQSGAKVTPRLKSAFEKLIELERLGALTSEQFYDVVRRALKLPELNAKDAAELRRLAQAAQREPEGYLRQQAAANVMKLTERLSGNARLRDVPMAIFYANILSGLTTPAKIVFENMNLLASSTVASLLTRPRDLMHPVEFMSTLAKAYGRGLMKGAAQAAGTLKTGVVSGLWADARPPTVLEMKPFGERLEPLNFWKYFIRVISTAHETTFKPGWEMRQTMIARDVARREGLTGKDLAQRTADLLANTKEHITGARAQAIAELQGTGELNAIDLRRRTGEIIEQQREANMPGSTETAREYALRMAYLNEPYGFLGLLTRGLRSVLENARRQYPVFGTGVKTQIPFTTIIANILNEKLNWTPWGLARGMMAKRTGEIYGRPALPGEHAELYAKAMVGTAALGALYYLLGDRIHGNGPSDPNKRKQLQAAGWVPHSIQVGDKFVSYMNTPAAMGLAVIGNLNDWHRYGKGDEATAASRATFALKATGNAIISQGMLDSVRRIFEAIGSESTAVGADKLEKVMARTASSFVVPNLVQQLDRIWDPTMYDQTGIEALVKSQIPFVRRDNKPVLTVLGDPVKAGPFHPWASQITDDPLLRTLAEKQAWVPEPSRNQLIGDRRRGPDYSRSLTPDEFYEFIAMSGPEIRRRLSENLDRITDMDPDQARKFVAQMAEQEHAKAKKTFE